MQHPSSLSLSAWPIGVDDVAPGWQPVVEGFLRSPQGQRLTESLQAQLTAGAIIYPPQPLRALHITPPETVRVLILGQDPYHGPGQANGLAFAVPRGMRPPPSLRNICEELRREYGRAPQPDGLLDHWARQGVLLLNTSLTVIAGQAGSHAKLGWQSLTTALCAHLLAQPHAVVCMLWGNHARTLPALDMLNKPPIRHISLLSSHPSPLSARRTDKPFIGCNHFRQANAQLQAWGQPQIDWLGDMGVE